MMQDDRRCGVPRPSTMLKMHQCAINTCASLGMRCQELVHSSRDANQNGWTLALLLLCSFATQADGTVPAELEAACISKLYSA